MQTLLPFIVAGIVTGLVYGLAGAGLVLTYKTSGIFNFSHGAIGTVSACIFYSMHVQNGIGWIPSIIASVLGAGIVMGLIFERIAVRLARQSTAYQIIATIGVILIVQALASIKYGSTTIQVESFLPLADSVVHPFGVIVSEDKLVSIGITLVSVALLAGLLRFTRTGVAMRAIVDNSDLLAMQGASPETVRRLAWVIGSVFAGLAGVLILPLVGLNSILLTLLVVQAFGAAAFGLFSNIPMTVVGGVVIGIAASVTTHYVIADNSLTGLPSSIPFIVLLVVLLAAPKRKLARISRFKSRATLHYRAPLPVRLGTGVAVIVFLAFVPSWAGGNLTFYTVALVNAMILLSLGLLIRLSGQVTLCHSIFAAVGAVAFSQLVVDHHVPWLVGLLLAGLIVVPLGALVALPAIRLSGLFVALATLGFGILVENLFYPQTWMFGTSVTGRVMPLPGFAQSQDDFYFVVLGAVVLTGLLVVVIKESRLGRLLQGMSDSPTAVTAMGLSVNMSKTIIFGVSAFLAGLSGVLLGVTRGFAMTSEPFYGSFNSLVLLAMLGIAAGGEPWFALFPAAGLVIPAYVTGDNTSYWLNFAFGLSAVLVALQGGTPTMPERIRQVLDRLGRRKAAPSLPPADLANSRRKITAADGLAIENVSVHFGGIHAVEDVTLRAEPGRITGLIGPNGAGKTTTFNACSGFVRRHDGAVLLAGQNVKSHSPSNRARLGLGRTFQIVELCENLTVAENISLASEAADAGVRPQRHLFGGRAHRRLSQALAREAMELCGITDLATTQAGLLSTGQRRLVELARCLAGDFSVLLLDEPSSGLDHAETARFGELLKRVVAERGSAVLLVEHDMGLVMDVCDYIYVLDFGRLLFEGPPGEVAGSELVRSAYLGDELVGSSTEAEGRVPR